LGKKCLVVQMNPEAESWPARKPGRQYAIRSRLVDGICVVAVRFAPAGSLVKNLRKRVTRPRRAPSAGEVHRQLDLLDR
jgi:hypothetical protein